MKKSGAFEDDVLYRADLGELKEAEKSYAQIRECQILELEQFCRDLKPDQFKLGTFNRWFEEKKLQGCRIHRLIAYVLHEHSDPESRRRTALLFIRRAYRSDLVQQYEPLILCSGNYALDCFRQTRAKHAVGHILLSGITLNGKKVHIYNDSDEENLSLHLDRELKTLGSVSAEIREFLKFYLFYAAAVSNNFSEIMLKKVNVGASFVTDEVFLEFYPERALISVQFVRGIRKFYRMRNLGGQGYDDPTAAFTEALTARSTTCVHLVLKRELNQANQDGQISPRFFQSQAESFDISVMASVFDVYDEPIKKRLLREFAKDLSQKIRTNELLDGNDEILINHFTRELSEMTDRQEIINALIAGGGRLKIVLAARMNRLLLKKILKTPELLFMLCSDPAHLDYLEVLRSWYMLDDEVKEQLTTLLSYIKIVSQDCQQRQWEEQIIALINKDNQKNLLLKIAAVFTILAKQNRSRVLKFLVTNPNMLSLLQKTRLIVFLAIHFREITDWLFETEYVVKLGLSSDEFTQLVIGQPVIWEKLLSLGETVRNIPEKLLSSRAMSTLLLKNEDDTSREQATLGVCRSRGLLNEFFSLQESDPNGLLRYFARFQRHFREKWPKEYAQCESKLLPLCEEEVVREYFEGRFCQDQKLFIDSFCAIVLYNRFDNHSERTRRLAKESLISLFIRSLSGNLRLDAIWNNQRNIKYLVELAEREPRIVSIVNYPRVLRFLEQSEDRNALLTLVDCVVCHCQNPEVNNTNTAMPLLSLLTDVELQSLLKRVMTSVRDRYFVLVLLINNPEAIALFVKIGLNFESEEFRSLLMNASAEHRLLFLFSMLARENELREKIEAYASKSQLEPEQYATQMIDKFTACTPMDCSATSSPSKSVEISQEIRHKLTKQLSVSTGSVMQSYLTESQLHRNELEAINQIKKLILGTPQQVDAFLDLDNITVLEIACVISQYPNFSNDVDVDTLGENLKRKLKKAELLVQFPKDPLFELLISSSGADIVTFSRELKTLLTQDPSRFYTLVNACLILAFSHKDIRSGILATQDFSGLLMLYAHPPLLAKFFVLYCKSSQPKAYRNILTSRLIKSARLLSEYGTFIPLPHHALDRVVDMARPVSLEDTGWELRFAQHRLVQRLDEDSWAQLTQWGSQQQMLDMVPYCQNSCPTFERFLVSLMNCSVLAPNQILNLLILTQELLPEFTARSAWLEFINKPQSVCAILLNNNRPSGLILEAILALLKYYKSSTEYANSYIDEQINLKTCKSSNLGSAICFLVSDLGIEVAFPQDGSDISEELLFIIVELYILSNSWQLKLYLRKDYVRVLIDYCTRFNSEPKVYQQYWLPRIALILLQYFEIDPGYVEGVFQKNQTLVQDIKSSQTAIDLIVSSRVYEESERIRSSLNIEVLERKDLLTESKEAQDQSSDSTPTRGRQVYPMNTAGSWNGSVSLRPSKRRLRRPTVMIGGTNADSDESSSKKSLY